MLVTFLLTGMLFSYNLLLHKEHTMPYVDVWIHFVFATKSRMPLLSQKLLPLLIEKVKTYSQKKDIHVDSLNGYRDHLHLLVSLGNSQTLGQIVQSCKGYSSYWISNNSEIGPKYFKRQNGYYAKSVSSKDLKQVRKYIRNQAEHHQKLTLQNEIRILGFDRILKPGRRRG